MNSRAFVVAIVGFAIIVSVTEFFRTANAFAKYSIDPADVSGKFLMFNKKHFATEAGDVEMPLSTKSVFINALGSKNIKKIDGMNAYTFESEKIQKADTVSLQSVLGDEWVIQPIYQHHTMAWQCSCATCTPSEPSPIPTPGPVPKNTTWGQAAIHAAEAQALVNVAAGPPACDVDTGLDQSVINEFAPGTIIDGASFVPGQPWNQDGAGHGTHTAGTIASLKYGVAPGVKLIPVKGLSNSGSGTSDGLGKAVKYCADKGAKYINESWGMDSGSDPFIDASNDYAVSKGAIVVAAAGNSGGAIGSPGKSPNVKTATAETEQFGIASFSSRGTKVGGEMYLMPGTNVISLWPCPLDSKCSKSLQGTSMSAPHLTGVYILMAAGKKSVLKVINRGLAPSLQGKGQVDALLTVQ